MNHYKVIFHIDEMSKWNLLLSNVENFIKELNVQSKTIEVLSNSEAVKFFVRDTITKDNQLRIETLIKQGIVFSVCNNSLLSNKIDPKSLLNGIYIVPSGVVELAIKQYDSYAYIKP